MSSSIGLNEIFYNRPNPGNMPLFYMYPQEEKNKVIGDQSIEM